jgi:hypothetical protein
MPHRRPPGRTVVHHPWRRLLLTDLLPPGRAETDRGFPFAIPRWDGEIRGGLEVSETRFGSNGASAVAGAAGSHSFN